MPALPNSDQKQPETLDFAAPQLDTRARLRDAGLSYAAVVLCAIAIIWVSIYFRLLTEYEQTEADAYHETGNLAISGAENLRRSLAAVDQALQFISLAYRRDPQHFDLQTWIPGGIEPGDSTVHLGLVDAAGVLHVGSTDGASWPSPISTAALAEMARPGPERMVLGPPERDPRTGEWLVNAMRRITLANGEPGGFAVASIGARLFTRFYDGLPLHNAAISVVGAGGRVLAATPNAAEAAGQPFDGPEAATILAPDSSGGSLLQRGTVEGTSRLVSYRRLVSDGLTVVVALDDATVFARFRRHRAQTMVAGIILTVLISAAALLMLRQHQRLTNSREALEVTLQSIGQGIMMIDADGNLPVMNRRVAELLDLPDTLLDAMPNFRDLLRWQFENNEFGPRDKVPQVIIDALEAGQPIVHNEVLVRTRPNGRVLEVRTALLRNGGAVRTWTDVTERHRSEEAISAARDAAEAAGRTRSEFLAVMSHEIRTPMNGIIGVAGLLLDMKLGATEQHYVRIVQESGQHLLQLINDILDFSRLDAGRLELEETPFEVAAVVRGAIELLSQQARAKGLELRAEVADDVPRGVVGDPHRLRQVLLNLISNGLKFTHEGSVRVVVNRIRSEPGGIRLGFEVHDTGIGIPQAALGRLFTEFTQVDSSISRRFGGSGLGLAISRRLIERMGGTIGVESAEGKGSRFSFDILLRSQDGAVVPPARGWPPPPREAAIIAPLHAPPRPAAEGQFTAPPAVSRPATQASATSPPATQPPAVQPPSVQPAATKPAAAGQRRVVLVAEDNATNRLVVTRMLERLGHRVEAVENGAEAVAAVRRGGHDVVLMDVMMPEMDGLAATVAIRALDGPAARIPIIWLTANAMRDSEAQCLAAGMNHFEIKPINVARLADALARVLPLAAPLPAPPPSPQAHFDAAVLNQLVRDIASGPTLDVVNRFIALTPIQLARMQDAIGADPAAGGLGIAAARLARAARGVGLPRLAAAAAELADAPAGGASREAIGQRLAGMQAMLRSGIDELRAWRPTG